MYSVRLIQPQCSCGMIMGSKQYLAEEMISKGMTMSEVCENLGWMRMCCQVKYKHCELQFLHSSDKGRITDRTGFITNGKNMGDYTEDSKPIKLKRDPPPFPTNMSITKEKLVLPSLDDYIENML